MEISSNAFSDGGRIPEKYGYKRDNIHPPLKFSDIPESAESLAIVVDDPDAKEPAGKIWEHWLIWNISPETTEIDEGQQPIGAREGMNDFGKRGYGGPNPPDGEHVYRFKLYALDRELNINDASDREDLKNETENDIIEKAVLKGSFKPI
ncbi:MAG: YbhB/YbcL family Raf kinase inhibitor-like protein [Candidatus Nanohalobium sp.]